MNEIDTLSDLRESVQEALEVIEGLLVLDHTDYARIQPPVAITVPTDPFMTPGDAFGSWDMGMQVILIPKSGENSAKDLEDLVLEAIHALHEFDVIAVSAPQSVGLTYAGRTNSYWASVVTIEFNTTISRKDV